MGLNNIRDSSWQILSEPFQVPAGGALGNHTGGKMSTSKYSRLKNEGRVPPRLPVPRALFPPKGYVTIIKDFPT